ncbi:chemotaxis protein CheY [Methanomassiliicoccales archaeon RumEn M1]|nr:chemotaxis protein CheY [Methanomassiliicoccales archaeon RumEn M1]
MAANENEVLLVEDDPNDAELIVRAFKKGKLTMSLVHLRDGAEAMDYVNIRRARERASLPKVIMLDLKLPKLNGLEVLRKLKSDVLTRDIPVVILTSSQEESDIAQAYSLGVNSYILKPIESDEFSKTVVDMGSYWLRLNRTRRRHEGDL